MKLQISSTGQLNLFSLCLATIGDFFFLISYCLHITFIAWHIGEVYRAHTFQSSTTLDSGNLKTEDRYPYFQVFPDVVKASL